MESDNHPDQQLLAQIKSGDKVAFRKLFNQHYRELLGTAINILRDEAKGKDAVQEVFLNVWNKRENLEIHSSIGSYLKRAVINRSLNQIRREKPFVDDSQLEQEPAGQGSALDEMALQDLETALNAALETLPERCRLVFVMKRLEGMSQKEIAEALEISPKTVENQITKAMKALKEALKSYRSNNLDHG